MKITRRHLINIINETYEDVRKESEMSHIAEDLASSLKVKWGEEAAFKILIYAADVVRPGSYQPDDVEKDEFRSEPFPGARRIPLGSLKWK
jgi:hypothetical protein